MSKDTLRLTVAAIGRTRRDGVLALAVGASFLVCYASVFASLVQQWSSNDMYAHGFLIPVISAYLLWERRASLVRAVAEPDFVAGPLLLGAGLLILTVGNLGGIVSLSQLSLLVTALGIVALLFGRTFLREAWFPLLFLLFMIPVWETVTNRLQTPFQLLSAQIGTSLLRTVGIPIYLDGILLYLPNITLEVAQACSGVNFVVAILALAIPQAYLMLHSAALRVAVAAFAVVVALLTNGLRVAVIGVLAYSGVSGPDVHGPGHALQGLFVAIVGFVIVFSTIVFLARWSPARARQDPTDDAGERTVIGPSPRLKAALLASALLLLAPAVYGFQQSESIRLALPLADFPSTFERAWFATGVEAAPPLRTPGADDELTRTYVGPGQRAVRLYVAYFREQRQGKEAVNERVQQFHQGASPLALQLPNGVVKHVNAAVRPLPGGASQHVVFWYEMNGRTVANSYAAKAWTIWDSMASGRSNAGLVMLAADVPAGGDGAAAARDVQALARLTAAALDKHFPR